MHEGNRQFTRLLFFAHSIKVPFSRNSIFDSIAKFDISHKTPNRHRPEQQLIDAVSTLVDYRMALYCFDCIELERL